MTTPLYPTFQKRISDSFDQLIKNQVTPWVFLNTGKPMRVKTHDNRPISYEGVGFEGSPEQVFWSRYIDPFMEEICICEINDAIKMSTERNVDAKLLLPEVEGLLLSGVTRTFHEMSQIDQRLKGKGFPEKVHAHPIENEVQIMKNFIEVRIKSELDMWQPKSKFESWYERNKFIIWAMGTIVALIGLCARFR